MTIKASKKLAAAMKIHGGDEFQEMIAQYHLDPVMLASAIRVKARVRAHMSEITSDRFEAVLAEFLSDEGISRKNYDHYWQVAEGRVMNHCIEQKQSGAYVRILQAIELTSCHLGDSRVIDDTSLMPIGEIESQLIRDFSSALQYAKTIDLSRRQLLTLIQNPQIMGFHDKWRFSITGGGTTINLWAVGTMLDAVANGTLVGPNTAAIVVPANYFQVSRGLASEPTYQTICSQYLYKATTLTATRVSEDVCLVLYQCGLLIKLLSEVKVNQVRLGLYARFIDNYPQVFSGDNVWDSLSVVVNGRLRASQGAEDERLRRQSELDDIETIFIGTGKFVTYLLRNQDLGHGLVKLGSATKIILSAIDRIKAGSTDSFADLVKLPSAIATLFSTLTSFIPDIEDVILRHVKYLSQQLQTIRTELNRKFSQLGVQMTALTWDLLDKFGDIDTRLSDIQADYTQLTHPVVILESVNGADDQVDMRSLDSIHEHFARIHSEANQQLAFDDFTALLSRALSSKLYRDVIPSDDTAWLAEIPVFTKVAMTRWVDQHIGHLFEAAGDLMANRGEYHLPGLPSAEMTFPDVISMGFFRHGLNTVTRLVEGVPDDYLSWDVLGKVFEPILRDCETNNTFYQMVIEHSEQLTCRLVALCQRELNAILALPSVLDRSVNRLQQYSRLLTMVLFINVYGADENDIIVQLGFLNHWVDNLISRLNTDSVEAALANLKQVVASLFARSKPDVYAPAAHLLRYFTQLCDSCVEYAANASSTTESAAQRRRLDDEHEGGTLSDVMAAGLTTFPAPRPSRGDDDTSDAPGINPGGAGAEPRLT